MVTFLMGLDMIMRSGMCLHVSVCIQASIDIEEQS